MTSAPGELPKLAVVFDPRATRAFRFAEASAGCWETLWLVDTARFDVGPTSRLLARLGTVIDIGGLDPDDVALLLAPFRPAGIIAFADSELVRTSFIARALGLPFHSPDVAARLNSKVAQREAFAKAGLSVPNFWPMAADADAATRQRTTAMMRFPVIVKPQAGAGGRRTYRATDATDLLRWLAEPPDDADVDLADVVVEELLVDGWARDEREYADYVSVESVAQNGRVTHLAVTGRLPLAEPFREAGFFIPSNLPEPVLAAVRELAGRAIDALGAATNGVFHTEIKITPAGPRLIEVNGRIGGRTPDILAICSDIRPFEIAARVALGLPIEVGNAPVFNGVGYLAWVQPPMNATSLVRLNGIAEIGASEGVAEVIVNKRPGDALDWRNGNHGFSIAVLGWAADHDAMFAARRRITEMIDIEYGYTDERHP